MSDVTDVQMRALFTIHGHVPTDHHCLHHIAVSDAVAKMARGITCLPCRALERSG